jgi:hypothetical protein
MLLCNISGVLGPSCAKKKYNKRFSKKNIQRKMKWQRILIKKKFQFKICINFRYEDFPNLIFFFEKLFMIFEKSSWFSKNCSWYVKFVHDFLKNIHDFFEKMFMVSKFCSRFEKVLAFFFKG